ncbi:MAG: hypothetical protein LC640_05990, partial [Frankia sp.]|nr:hypothetical protein [Frankia sp.]
MVSTAGLTVVGVVVAVALLATAVSVASRVPSTAALGGLRRAILDYARGPHAELPSLTDAFVSDALGQRVVSPGAGRPLGATPAGTAADPDVVAQDPGNGVEPADVIAGDVDNDAFSDAYGIRGL